MYKKILHGYRQFMLKDVWSIPLMNETLFLLFVKVANKINIMIRISFIKKI